MERNEKTDFDRLVSEFVDLFGSQEINTFDLGQDELAGLFEMLGKCDKRIYDLGMLRNKLEKSIGKIERKKFGEEIKRDKNGDLKVPWDKIITTQISEDVENAFRKIE